VGVGDIIICGIGGAGMLLLGAGAVLLLSEEEDGIQAASDAPVLETAGVGLVAAAITGIHVDGAAPA
jgi:hypothetical protein